MPRRPDTGNVAAIAMAVAAVMIAQQVAGKATRDALFLSNFQVSQWPAMLVTSSLISILVAVLVARSMGVLRPDRLVPAAFGVSAALLVGVWALSFRGPRVAAIGLYLHTAVLGPVLISGFWSMFTERFDPRTAKREIGRIGAIGTLGGLGGGLLAAPLAQRAGVANVMPVLALMHVFCAVALRGFGTAVPGATQDPRDRAAAGAEGEETAPAYGAIAASDAPAPEALAASAEMLAGFRTLIRSSYLSALALLVTLGTISAALLDYVFRVHATAGFPQEGQLIRVFSWFYATVALAAFLVQTTLSRLTLSRMRLAETVATLPIAVVGGSLGVLLVPGLLSSAIARGLEMVVRSSLFRSGYELLYTPIAPQEKRATKTIVDVGFERLGDAVGGGAVALALFLAPGAANFVLMVVAAVLGLVALAVAFRLHHGYVAALESSIVRGAAGDVPAVADLSQTMTLPVIPRGGSAAYPTTDPGTWPLPLGPPQARAARDSRGAADSGPAAPARPELEDFMERVRDLRSTDPERNRRALARGPLDAELVPHALPLLGSDAMAHEAARALREAAPRTVGQLLDWLVDPERDLAVRRRIPRLLTQAPGERTVEGLLRGLEDPRFEIRLRCGRALARIREQAPELPMDRERVLAAVRREVAVERRVWESQREIARLEESSELTSENRFLLKRANASLEHVFTLLSLALAQQPLLRMAFHDLHLDDPLRRGTALEYLEVVLPPDIRERLWPFLEEGEARAHPLRPREEIIADLTRSHESIQISIAEIRRLAEERGKPTG